MKQSRSEGIQGRGRREDLLRRLANNNNSDNLVTEGWRGRVY